MKKSRLGLIGFYVVCTIGFAEPASKATTKFISLFSDSITRFEAGVKDLSVAKLFEAPVTSDVERQTRVAHVEKRLMDLHKQLEFSSTGVKLLQVVQKQLQKTPSKTLEQLSEWLLETCSTIESLYASKAQKKALEQMLKDSNNDPAARLAWLKEQYLSREKRFESFFKSIENEHHQDIEALVAKKIENNGDKLDKVFEFEMKATLQREKEISIPAQADLSPLFPAVQRQGESKACGAFAIASDLSFESRKHISPAFTYVLYRSGPGKRDLEPFGLDRLLSDLMGEKVDKIQWAPAVPNNVFEYFSKKLKVTSETELFKKIDRGTDVEEALEFFKENPLTLEASYASQPLQKFPDFLNEIPNRIWLVDTFETSAFEFGEISPSVLKRMIALKRPPIVSITTDARSFSEDWFRPEVSMRSLGHVLNIVGYGVGIDPFDGEKKNYFLVRDSLVPRAFHYKVSENELMYVLRGVHKVLSVKQVDKPVLYKDIEER